MRAEESRAATRPLAGEASEFLVRAVDDRETLRRMLLPAAPYTAYALGQLEPWLFPLSRWWVAKGAVGWGLIMHSAGGLGNALLTLGEETAVEAALSLHPGPRQTFATAQVRHADVLHRHFHVAQDAVMMRMVVGSGDFTACPGPVRRLSGGDAGAVNRLYRSDGASSFYSPHQLEDAIYYGIFDDGQLVSIAGTHVVSPTYGVAVVGNVYTRPSHRGLRYATMTTSAVTEALLAECRQVVLSVDPDNEPAVRAYQALGYREESRLLETAAVCKPTSTAAATARRVTAGLRGRRYGAELVRVRTGHEEKGRI